MLNNQLYVFSQQDFSQSFVVHLNPPLGQGHDARVYLAMHKRSGELYALKVLTNLSQDHLRNLQVPSNEIQILRRIDFPGTVALKGHADDCTCVLLEYMPNDTFLTVLKKGPIELPLARTLSRYLANVLQSLHHAGVMHCDIKPENILIAQDFQLKLCDFGFARVAIKDATTQAPPGGTPGYTAPEMYVNQLVDLQKCDVFALGVVLFIVVLGFPPFQTNDPTARDAWWNLINTRQWEYFWQKCEQFREKTYPIAFKVMMAKLLEPDPEQRMSVAELLKCEFLNGECATEMDVLQEIKKRVCDQ